MPSIPTDRGARPIASARLLTCALHRAAAGHHLARMRAA